MQHYRRTLSTFFLNNQNRRKLFLIGLVVFLLLFTLLRVVQSFSKAGKEKPIVVSQMQLKSTEVLTVAPGVFLQTLPLSGALNPYTQAIVSARASGEIATVLVREGQAVQSGQTLATLVNTNYRAQLDQAVANVTSSASALGLAQQDYNNNQKLVAEKFISPIALQKIEVALASSKAQLENAKQAVVIAQRALSETHIKAPMSGIINARHVQAGESAASGMAMFSIVNIDQFEMQAPISAEQIGLIKIGQTVELSSTGLKESFNGVVERINPAATNGSRSYVAYIRIDNSTGLLKAGMFAQGKIVINKRDNVIGIPLPAVHEREQQKFVYAVKNNQLVEQIITTGDLSSDAIDAPIEVTSGLSAGDVVVRLDLGELKVNTDVLVLSDKPVQSDEVGSIATQASWWQKIKNLFGGNKKSSTS